MNAELQKFIAPLVRRVRLMVSRCVLISTNDDSGTQTAQVALMNGEVRDGVECVQSYGFTSRPLADAPGGVMVSLGGNHDLGLIIARDDRRYRLRGLEPGEVALYDDQDSLVELQRGQKIYIKANVEVIVEAPIVTIKAATKVRMETPLLEVTGEIKDRCDTTGKTMAGMRSTYDTHTHPGDSGGTTAAPNQKMS